MITEKELRDLLLDLEWSSYTRDEHCCPSCGAFHSLDLPKTANHSLEVAGYHKAGCKLWEVLQPLLD